MKIGIINNAANYLKFNVNLGNYLKKYGDDIVFLNCDKYIKSVLRKYNHQTVDYPQPTGKTNSIYNESSSIVRYYKRLYNLKDTQKLIENLNREYQQAFSYLSKTYFDYVLILNGSFNVETDVCKALRIKCFFFEHGYFPKCIQMDGAGVNIDASFSKLSYESFMDFNYPCSDFEPLPDFELIEIPQSKILRYLTRLSDKRYNANIFSFFRKKINNEKAVKRFRKFQDENLDLGKFKPFIFFPLQVNSDTQIILNSSYNSMYEAIANVLPALKSTGYKIIIKEHPLEVEPVDYSSFIDGSQVFLTRKANLEEQIRQSEFVVNINSSVGLQSIAKNKKVLVLGDSFYNNAPTVKSYLTLSKGLKEEMESIIIDEDVISKYINHFKENIFIPGHFYTPDIAFFERIRNRLI